MKTMKIGPLENFPIYGRHMYMIVVAFLYNIATYGGLLNAIIIAVL